MWKKLLRRGTALLLCVLLISQLVTTGVKANNGAAGDNAENANLIPNSDFEDISEDSSSDIWEAFAVNEGSGSISFVAEESGGMAAKISPDEGKDYALRLAGGDNVLSICGGTNYILSYDVKCLSDTASIRPLIRQMNGEYNSNTYPWYELVNYKVTGTNGEWKRVNCSFITDSNTTKGNIWLIANGGEVLVDNICLNNIPDYDFEDESINATTWEAFAVNEGSGSISFVAEESGGMAAKISPDAGKDYALRLAGGDNVLPICGGTNYILSYDVKCLSDTASIRPLIRQMNGEYNSNTYPWYELVNYKVTGTNGEWKRVSCSFTTDSNTTKGNIWIIANGGEVLVDNICLNNIPDSDFEKSISSAKLNGWETFQISGAEGTITAAVGEGVDNSVAAKISAPSGQNAMRLTGRAGEDGDCFLTLESGTWYALTYDIKTLSDSASLFPIIRQKNGQYDDSKIEDQNKYYWLTEYKVAGTNGEWKTVTCYFKTDSDTTNGNIWFTAEGGEVLLDNISLTVMKDEGNIPNPGFERLNALGGPADWELFNVSENAGTVTAAVGKGVDNSIAAKISSPSGKNALRVAGGDDFLTLESGTWYVLTYDIKTLSDSASLYPIIRQMNGKDNSNTRPFYELPEYKVTGTNGEWRTVNCYFKTDSDTTNGNIWLAAEGGEVLLDNISLTVMEDEGNIPNPGFERLNTLGGPADWEGFAINEGAGTISTVKGGGLSGTNAVKISPDSGKQYALRVAGGDNSLTLKADTWYVLTYDAKALSADTSLYPIIRQMNGENNSNTHPFFELQGYKITGTDDRWVSVKCYFRTDSDTTNGNLWLLAEGGQILIDNVSLNVAKKGEVPGKYGDSYTLSGEIPNPEFEYLNEAGGIADWEGFGVNDGAGSIFAAYNEGVNGSIAAKISPESGKQYALRIGGVDNAIALSSNTWYMLTYELKCLSDSASLYPIVRQVNGVQNSNQNPYLELPAYKVIGTNGKWITVNCYFRTDSDTTGGNLWLVAENGEVLIDNISLTVLPSEGPIFNPGFERVDMNGGIAGWKGIEINGGKGTVSAAIGEGIGGSNAALVHPTSAHYGLGLPDDLPILVKPKTSYVVTYYVKGLSEKSHLYLIVPQRNSKGNTTTENPYNELPIYAVSGKNKDFIEVKSYFRTAEDAADVRLWFNVWGGDVLIDNISIAEYNDNYQGDVNDCNLSFEQTENQKVKNWSAINFDSVSLNTNIYHGGSQSVNLVGSNLKEEAYYNCQAGIPVSEVNTYRFTVYIRSRNSIGARVFLNATGTDKNHAVIENVKGAETILSTNSEYGEWIPISVKYTPGADVTNVHLRIGVSKCVSADLLVDDIRLLNLNEADYVDEFSSLSESGYPADWYTEGDAKFTADGESLTVYGTGAFVRRFNELKNLNTYQFTGTFNTVGDAKAEIEITYFDYKNQVMGNHTESLSVNKGSDWTSFEFELETLPATYATIALKSNGGTVSFDRLQIQSVTADVTPGAEWSAKWIWYSEDYSLSLNKTRYFRDTFELAETPSKCVIQMTADDLLNFWVNGTKVEIEESESWENIKELDIAKYLTKGTNVLAFSVENLDYECGLLYEAMPVDAEGNLLGLIISDHMTLSTKVEPASDWYTVNYQEDDTWYYAKEKGRPGMQPWGLIPYDATVQSASSFELKDVSIEKKVKGGTIVQATLKVNTEHEFQKEFINWGILWKKNTNTRVCDVKLQLSTLMTEWSVGKDNEVKLFFEVPDFIPEGNYTLQLDPTSVTVISDKYMNNKICSFHVSQQKVETGYVNTSAVKLVDGNVKLYLNEEEVSPMLYIPADTYANVKSEYVYQMEETGISLIPIMVGSGISGANKIWLGVDEDGNNIYDWTAYDEKIIKCISSNPQSKLLVSFDASVPQWWLDKYPEEASLNVDGSTKGATFASEQWRSDMKQVMGDLIDHITSQSYAKFIYGLRITAGHTLEWLPWSDNIMDQSPATDAAFRVWLEEKYGTDAALRSAWNNNSVKLKTATQPSKEQANSQTYNTLLDVNTQMQVIDYHRFLADTTADAFLEFCGYAKEKTEGNWIVGGYFGYIWNSYSYEANGTLSLAVSKVVQSDDVDYLCGPLCYDERQQGEPAPFQSMVDSLTANGKLWISENDIRTVAYQTPYNELDASAHGQNYTMSDTRSALIREFSNELIKGTGLWWYDMTGGWFNDKQIYDILTIMQEEMTANLSRTRKSASEVAVFVDEDVYAYTSYNFGAVYNWLYGTNLLQRQQLATMGAPYDIYYLSDLEKGVVTKDYKVNIILNAVEIDASESASIENKLKRDGKTIVWIYLPGFSDGEVMDVSNIQKITGFEGLQLITESNSGDSVLKKGSAHTKGVEDKVFGAREYNSVMPIVSIGDTKAEVLGTYSDGCGTSLAVKDMGNWTSVYSAVPELPAQLLTNILKQAGVHVYSDNRDDIIFANENYIALHCRYGGEKTVSLPQNYSVYDVMNGKTISLNTNTITFTAEDNSTTLFRLTKADTVTMLTYVKGSGGTIEAAGMEELIPGADYKITFEAEEGYELYSVMVNDQETAVKGNVLKLTNVQENTRVVAVFKKPLPTVTTMEESTSYVGIIIVVNVILIATTILIIWLVKYRKKDDEAIGKVAKNSQIEE